jgi:hypothetical protein
MTEHPHRATIAPVPTGVARPLWSVMIPTYNCARHLRQTLESVLAQDPGPEVMQIEVVDDHSTADDPAAVVAELGGGRVAFHRQERNVGHTRNFATCLRRSRGLLIHQLHGDDLVRDGFYRTMERAFAAHPEIGAAFCRHDVIGEQGQWQSTSPLERETSGILDDWLATLALGQRIQTPAMVVRRAVYERLGGFDERLSWTEDWEMWVRIAAHYPVWYEVESLAVYRAHAASNTGQYMRTGETSRDMRRAIEINRGHLPPERAGAITSAALASAAQAAVRRAHRRIDAGDLASARAYAREALRGAGAWPVALRVGHLLARLGWHMVRRGTADRS